MLDRLRQQLHAAARAGGWPYYAGKGSRIEPTCWALLALAAAWPEDTTSFSRFARPHLDWLAGLQSRDGLLVETEPTFANLTANALAAIVLMRLGGPEHEAVLRALCQGIVSVKGVGLGTVEGGQDNTLQGWPWVRDTFSWVEPTAWCLLALKVATPTAPGAADRISEAERLLTNRVCGGGGWNYGNASTLGQDLRPYVPTTAVALLAMQDRRTDAPVQQSVQRLTALRSTEHSAVALGLTALALRLHGAAVDDVEDQLAEVVPRAEDARHLQAIAIALYALSADTHLVEMMRVGA